MAKVELADKAGGYSNNPRRVIINPVPSGRNLIITPT
jgi:hypothetical protein